jgi:hypothetical protein
MITLPQAILSEARVIERMRESLLREKSRAPALP